MVLSQHELEARYAEAVGATTSLFVYAGHVDEVLERFALAGERDVAVDALGGVGLRVPDLRARAQGVHVAGGRLLADITVPSHFGCRIFELGADVSFEAFDRIAAGKLQRKVVAVAARGPLTFDADELDTCDLVAIAEGLSTVPERMQRHFDHARALAEYLSCCEGLASVSYPGLPSHPDHEVATRMLMHGFGPAVEFQLDSAAGMTAGEFIEACRLNGRTYPVGGSHTRMCAPNGSDGHTVRIFAGLDNPLEVAAELDRVFRSLRRGE